MKRKSCLFLAPPVQVDNGACNTQYLGLTAQDPTQKQSGHKWLVGSNNQTIGQLQKQDCSVTGPADELQAHMWEDTA